MNIRTKHRLLRTAWLVLSIFLIGITVYISIDSMGTISSLIIGFILGIILFISYELILLQELQGNKKENRTYIRNNLTQIYMGILSLFTATLSFILAIIYNIDGDIALFIFSGLTIILLIWSYPYAEKKIEEYIR